MIRVCKRKYEYEINEIREEFEKVKVLLVRKSLPLYFLLSTTRIIYVDKEGKDLFTEYYAQTDGFTIYLYKQWKDLPVEQKAGVIIHELLHILLRHPERGMELQRRYGLQYHLIINLAMDAKVNLYINKLFNQDLLKKWEKELGLTEEEIEKLSIEEIVEKLLEKVKQNQKSPPIEESSEGLHSPQTVPSAGSGNINKDTSASSNTSQTPIQPPIPLNNGADVIPLDQKKEEEGIELNKGKRKPEDIKKAKEELEKKIIESLLKAKMARAQGFAIFDRILDELLKPKVNWRILLRKALYDGIIAKTVLNTWLKPNRRLPDIVPGYKILSVGDIWAFIDVSGSISDQEFKQFLSEVAEITKSGGKVHLITWDTDVTGHYVIKSKYQMINIKFKGGGGTTFAPVFKKFIKSIKHDDMIVILTDGHWFDLEKAIKLLKPFKDKVIICTTDAEIPVGKNIKIRL